MARRKRTSPVLETARQRLAGLRSITPPPDFGASLKLDDYEQDIQKVSDKLNSYLQKLSESDALLNELEALEEALNDKNKRMKAATGAQYGTNSSQYEQVGGTRDDERKKPTKKTPSKG
ncbi:MAG: hypothetical protein ICV60_10770 [Pyrinomonadaceae bacterium]|nr:hypothetical protein [Pyrinomonadaceae bacterium]